MKIRKTVSAEVFRLVNVERKKAGVSPLERNSTSDRIAVDWSETMARTGDFMHRPNFTSQYPCGWHAAPGNILMRSAGSGSATGLAAAMVQQWMGSSRHRQNILGASYTDLGVGVAQSSKGSWYATQNFAGH